MSTGAFSEKSSPEEDMTNASSAGRVVVKVNLSPSEKDPWSVINQTPDDFSNGAQLNHSNRIDVGNDYVSGSDPTAEYGEPFSQYNIQPQSQPFSLVGTSNTELKVFANASLANPIGGDDEPLEIPSQLLDFVDYTDFNGFEVFYLSNTDWDIGQFLPINTSDPGFTGNEDLDETYNSSALNGPSDTGRPFRNTPDEDSTPAIGPSVSYGTSNITPAATAILANGSRLVCTRSGCDKPFSRMGDRRRHEKKQHGSPQYNCTLNNCNRKGANAFRRQDKLHDHQRKVHGTAA